MPTHSNIAMKANDLKNETYTVKQFGETVKSQLYQQYVKQHGGFILRSVYLSAPIDDELFTQVDDTHDVFKSLHQVGRTADLHIDAEINGLKTEEEWLGFEKYTDELQRIVTSYPVKLLEIRDLDDGTPGLHPFGNLVGKAALFRKFWDPVDVSPQLLIKGNLEKFFNENNSDQATRYLYEKFDIDILQYSPDDSSGTTDFRSLPPIQDKVKGGRITGARIDLEEEADFPSVDASGEDRLLNWYYKNCLENGLLFREFSVTNMIENSKRNRRLDGLLIRSNRNDEIYKPTMKNKGYRYAKDLMDRNHPVQAIEVHKWGWEGFGQLLGKSALLEDFWGAEIVKKVLIVKNTQGRRFERLDPGNPQIDLESIMDKFGIRIVIAPEEV